MTKYFKTPFAATGDKNVVPDATQPGGEVSYAQGFGYDYERDYSDPLAKDIGREDFNGIIHDITEALGESQQHGVPIFHADMKPYPKGALVWFNGEVYASAIANNSNDIPNAAWYQVTVGGPSIPVFATTPLANVSPIIYVVDREQILLWKTIGSFTGYASREVGDFVWGTSQNPKPGREILIGQNVNATLAKYEALAAWADNEGHIVSSGSWTAGMFAFVDMGGGMLKLPDLRDRFIRATGTDADTANPKPLGTIEDSQNKAHTHKSGAKYGYGYSQEGYSTVKQGYIYETSSEGGAESRPINVRLHPLICL